jgi:hypothetical protein
MLLGTCRSLQINEFSFRYFWCSHSLLRWELRFFVIAFIVESLRRLLRLVEVQRKIRRTECDMFCRRVVGRLALTFFIPHVMYWSLGVNSLCLTRKAISFVGDNVVGWWSDECRLILLMRLVDNEIESSPILDGIGSDLLWLSWRLTESPRVIKISHNDYGHSYSVAWMYCCTGSVFYCNTVLLYYKPTGVSKYYTWPLYWSTVYK